MRAWCHWTWSSSSSSSSKSECTYIQTRKNTTRLLRLVALCAVLYIYRDVSLRCTRFVDFYYASVRLCDEQQIWHNKKHTKDNRLTIIISGVPTSDLEEKIVNLVREYFEKKKKKIKIYVQVRQLFIRKCHKIWPRACFWTSKGRLFQKKKKERKRIDGRGEAAALHHACTRCTDIKMRVVFRRRNLYNAARVFDRISLGGSAVTQDMCQRRCVVKWTRLISRSTIWLTVIPLHFQILTFLWKTLCRYFYSN